MEVAMPNINITFAVDDALLREIKVIAAQHGTNIN